MSATRSAECAESLVARMCGGVSIVLLYCMYDGSYAFHKWPETPVSIIAMLPEIVVGSTSNCNLPPSCDRPVHSGYVCDPHCDVLPSRSVPVDLFERCFADGWAACCSSAFLHLHNARKHGTLNPTRCQPTYCIFALPVRYCWLITSFSTSDTLSK